MNDASSRSGIVMRALSSSVNYGMLFGPYIIRDLEGASMLSKPYRAIFGLKVSSSLSTSCVVNIDVTYNCGVILKSMEIRASDFASSNTWQDFQVTFIAPSSLTCGLEFRVENLNNGITDVYIDQILVERAWDDSIACWEGAHNKLQSGSSWSKVTDLSSWSGVVMKASSSSPNGDWLYGPYITRGWDEENILGKPYSVVFRLKVSSNLPTSYVTSIDVAYNCGVVLKSMRIRASDFTSSNTWQDFQVTFIVPNSLTCGLEFRVENLNNGITDVYVDNILVQKAWDPSTVYFEGAYNKFQSGSSWSKENDYSSFSGIVMKASVDSPNGGWLYGPYMTEGWDGESMLGKPYTVTFRLKVSSNLSTNNIVCIDVCYNCGTVLQSMMIKAGDFTSSDVWQDFQVTFTMPNSLIYGLEFRVMNLNNGIIDVSVDYITVRSE